jgi:hypothetical protein
MDVRMGLGLGTDFVSNVVRQIGKVRRRAGLGDSGVELRHPPKEGIYKLVQSSLNIKNRVVREGSENAQGKRKTPICPWALSSTTDEWNRGQKTEARSQKRSIR